MTDYNKLKVTELKELLKERGIPSTGLSRKNQIVEALEANDASNADGAVATAEADGDGVSAQELQQESENVVSAEVLEEGQDVASTEELSQQPLASEATSAQDNAIAEAPIMDPGPAITEVEKNEPLSKEPSVPNTPQRPSPEVESMSSDTRKRKRRSTSPSITEESVLKKLKSAEEDIVKLPEDEIVEDAPAPVAGSQDATNIGAEQETALPMSTSDDVMEAEMVVPVEDVTGKRPKSSTPMDTSGQDEPVEQPRSSPRPAPENSGPPSIHPPTRAIYIRDLVRPLQPQELRSHIIDIAASPPSDSVIATFHLNTLRTHAFVVFDTLQAASTARSTLHGRIWPSEPSRKELWVDFIPEAEVDIWIEEETSTSGRRDAKKWEIVYDTASDGSVIATHQEVTAAPPSPNVRRQSSLNTSAPAPAPGPGQGMPNAPLGPRADRPSTSSNRPLVAPAAPAPSPKPQATTFTALDSNFNSTTSKPKLYWLPASAPLVEKRLDELAAQTSRSWDKGRGLRDAGAVEKQLRRYTFEDGDRVVDNGADIPSFRSEGGRPPGMGRGGGRGGGGFRGRR